MIVRIITVHVKPEYRSEFEEETRLNHEGSVLEAGVLRFDVLRDAEDPNRYILYEVYHDNEATEAHKQTDHYARWKERVADMMSAPREATTCEVVAPTEAGAW